MNVKAQTKKQVAACELIKESLYQIKEYIEENVDKESLRNSPEEFSLIRFMSVASVEWLDDKIKKFDKTKEVPEYFTSKELKMLKDFVVFYKESSGEIFFAENLFDEAMRLLEPNDDSEEISIRNIE